MSGENYGEKIVHETDGVVNKDDLPPALKITRLEEALKGLDRNTEMINSNLISPDSPVAVDEAQKQLKKNEKEREDIEDEINQLERIKAA